MKRKPTTKDRYRTVRKRRDAEGNIISRLVENRRTGERKLTTNIHAVVNR